MSTDSLSTLEMLRNRLARVEAELSEARLRMPAHSVKPVFMAALLDLEDERDRLLDRIKTIEAGSQ